MRGGIRTYKIFAPVNRSAVFIIVFQSFRIIIFFIAEERTVFFQYTGIVDKQLPVIMPYLMPEMPQQGSVSFTKIKFVTNSGGFIRFFNIQRNNSIIMTCYYFFFRRSVSQKVKGDSRFLIFFLATHR